MRKIIITCIFSVSMLLTKAQTDSIPDVTKLLGLSLEDLMNIKVVTASGYMQTTAEAPSTIQVITAKQITERGYEQLEDALRDIPGIDMIHVNGYVPTLIYFRGMYGAENLRALLMIDGIAENNIIGSNDMAGPAYPLHNVDRIEIIWGPASALYGANAFGGVINIITKKGADMNGLYVEKGFGSFNTSTEKLSLGLRKGNFEFAFSGSLYNTDGPKFTNRDPNYSASYVHNAYSFNGNISYYTKLTKTTVGFRTYRTPMGWGTYSNSPTSYLGLPPQGNSNQGVIGVISRDFRGEKPGLDDAYLRTAFIQSEYSPNDKLSIMARATYRETGTGEDSYIYVTVDGTKMIRGRVTTYSNRLSGTLSANYSPASRHKLSAGIEVSQDNVEQGSRAQTFDQTVYLVDGRDTVINLGAVYLPRKFDIRTNLGSYFQYALNTKWLGKTEFTFGARYDHNSYFGDAFSPRIAVVNRPNDKLTFKLHFGTAFRSPTNLEIHQAGLNFELTTEKIKTYEANIIYLLTKNIRLQLNGFRNDLKDVIILGDLTGLSPDKNPGVFKITGAEAAINIDLTKKLHGYLNFTYQHATGKNLVSGYSAKLPAIPDVKGNAGITAQAGDLFITTLSANWIGKRPVQRTNPYGPVKGYFLTNFALSTKPLLRNRITASLVIHNVFNVTWLDPGFRTADGALYSTVLEQPGINGLVKICLSLDNL